MKSTRLNGLPETMRARLKQARRARGWSQRELGQRARLPQAHISAIETGKTAPRFDTLLDLVRVLDHDLVLVPRKLGPAIQALVRDYEADGDDAASDRPLYAAGSATMDSSEAGEDRDEP